MNEALPILYSFRRCPYAMRARLAMRVCGVAYEHREILLRDKPKEMLEASAKGTVPVLVVGGMVVDESLDVMLWALKKNDPDNWLRDDDTQKEMLVLIGQADTGFKENLDIYKYSSRHGAGEGEKAKENALVFLSLLDARLGRTKQLFGNQISLADMAIFPFVRQFAGVDRAWFDSLPMPALHQWLSQHIESDLFQVIMKKQVLWSEA
ncbi:MAG: glutathione S-transferase [Sphingomonadales bacterium]|nr:glutathione S-transferase [Sphingomonadales bacterium]